VGIPSPYQKILMLQILQMLTLLLGVVPPLQPHLLLLLLLRVHLRTS
jgi:hypothetical protein